LIGGRTLDSEAILRNLHAALVGEIRARKPEYLSESFSVAEIYQNLIPYRTHRTTVGVDMNADYEDALLRLLAGEADLLILESDAARAEIQEALAAGPSNTSFYREYAAASVRLNPVHLPPDSVAAILADPPAQDLEPDPGEEDELPDQFFAAASTGGEAGAVEVQPADPALAPPSESEAEGQEATVEDLIGTEPAAGISMDGGMTLAESLAETLSREGTEMEPPLESQDLSDDVASSITAPLEVDEMEDTTVEPEVAGGADDSPRCESCCANLPERAGLNFCPFCGSDLRVLPCGACGEPVEHGWRFCIVCGAETPGDEEATEG